MYAGQPNWVSDRDRADVTLRSAGAEETVADVFDVMANMSNPALFAASEAISLYERRENTALAKDTKDAILIAAGFIDVVTLLIPYVGFVKALGAFAKLSAMVLRNQASSIAERLPGAVVHQIIENRLAAVAPYWDVSLEVMPDVMPDAIADATLDGTLTTTRIPAMERGVAPSAWRANGMSESRESSQERAFEASKRRQRGSHTDRRG